MSVGLEFTQYLTSRVGYNSSLAFAFQLEKHDNEPAWSSREHESSSLPFANIEYSCTSGTFAHITALQWSLKPRRSEVQEESIIAIRSL